MNDLTILDRNIYTLMIKLLKLKYDLAPPIKDSMLNRTTICYNFRNVQKFQPERKRTVFYALETLLSHTPVMEILLSGFKQRNTLFKSDFRQWICNKCPC